jgi:PleD family two-component response regulator
VTETERGPVSLTISVGIAGVGLESNESATLLSNAASALYKAKSGRA